MNSFAIIASDLSVTDILVMPLICTFFGMLIYFLGQKKENSGAKAPWKWVGVLILGLGAGLGWQYFAPMAGLGNEVDATFVQSQYDAKRFKISMYGAFLLPLLALIACIIVHFIRSKSQATTIAEEETE